MREAGLAKRENLKPSHDGIVQILEESEMKILYLADGFDRNDHKQNVCAIVEADEYDHEAVQTELKQICDYERYCFHATQNITNPEAVPEAAKNVLFMSREELYAVAPDLNPRRRRKKARR
jgi:hypothetical protein